MEEVFLEVSDVSTSYKGFFLKNVNFSLNSGDIMGLIGGSGAGKSTLVKVLAGLKKLESGTIKFYVDDVPAKLNNFLGYSPQENSLFPYLTLEENIRTFGRLMGLKNKEINERMGSLLKRLKLEDAKDKKIVELSGGMAKRADIIIALVHDPKILILDEPFAGLDFVLISFIWGIVKDLSRQGKIIIVSSHLLPDIQKNCDKIGFISAGKYYDYKKILEMVKRGE